MALITLFETIPVILFLPLSLIDFYYFIGRNVMGDLLCEVRDELNTRPSTPPNSFTRPHSSSKRLSQPTNPSSDTTVDLTRNLSRKINSSNTVKASYYSLHRFCEYWCVS